MKHEKISQTINVDWLDEFQNITILLGQTLRGPWVDQVLLHL